MSFKPLAYHYTTRHCLEGIIHSGAIKPPPCHVSRRWRPVVMFSTAPLWEASAAKGTYCLSSRVTRRATFAEMEADGIARVVVDASALAPWPSVGFAAGMASTVIASLERSARAVGAFPEEWLGSLDPFPLRDALRLEVFHGGRWLRFYTGDDGVML